MIRLILVWGNITNENGWMLFEFYYVYSTVRYSSVIFTVKSKKSGPESRPALMFPSG